MATAYQVKRSDPLAVSDIKVTFDGDIPNDDDDDDDDDDNDYYARTIHATITGCETSSGKEVTLGQMNADFLQVQKAMQSPGGLCDFCDADSEALAMLYKACFSRSAILQDNFPDGYHWGDVLMVNTMRLEPQFRGYGIGLLALDKLVQHVAQASPAWGEEGLIALDPSSLTSDMVQPNDHEKIQDKLIQYYRLFGMQTLAMETKKHCAFVGHCVIYWRPPIHTVVPHLL